MQGRGAGKEGGGRIVILGNVLAATVAIKRKMPNSVYAFLPDRFYEYVESNIDRIALTKSGREISVAYAKARGGPRGKRRPLLLGELALMRDAAGGESHERWQGRIDAVYRAALDDPQYKAMERWADLQVGVLLDSIHEQKYPDDKAAAGTARSVREHAAIHEKKYPDDKAAADAIFKLLYSHAEGDRREAAEAAGAAERAGGAGADLVTIRSNLLAFAAEIEEATGGRLRIIDAQRVVREPTAAEMAKRAVHLRKIMPRKGERLTLEEFRARFGLLMLGRIGRSVRNHVILIVRERRDQRTYEKDGLVMCAGEGRYDQSMVKMNRAIRDSGPEGYPILLFERAAGSDDVVFKSCLRYRSHETLTNYEMDYYGPQETIMFKLEPVDCEQPTGAAP